GAETLEWTTTSPPPQYNFRRFLPVTSRSPVWDRPARDAGLDIDDPDDLRRETLATTSLDARPDYRLQLPGPSVWPFWLAMALSVTLLAPMFSLPLVPIGLLVAGLVLVGWNWPGDPT